MKLSDWFVMYRRQLSAFDFEAAKRTSAIIEERMKRGGK